MTTIAVSPIQGIGCDISCLLLFEDGLGRVDRVCWSPAPGCCPEARRSPTVRERRLARALRQLREQADLTIEEVAEKLEISASTVSRMETARVGVRPRDLRFLLDMYEVTEAERDQLLQIARERRQQRWWQEYADLANIAVAGLEEEASTISQYSTQLVPGLIQTEAYARAVLEAIRLDSRPGDVERRLELRIHRQALLTKEDAPEYWVVLDEAVVHRQVGGPPVMAQQLGHLIEVARRPNITLQVLPFTSGEHAGMNGEFTILRYRESADPDVVYIENTGSDLYLEAPDVTRRYNKIFDHLRAAAQNPSESIRTLGGIQSHLDQSERS